jgi:hypothetical protein
MFRRRGFGEFCDVFVCASFSFQKCSLCRLLGFLVYVRNSTKHVFPDGAETAEKRADHEHISSHTHPRSSLCSFFGRTDEQEGLRKRSSLLSRPTHSLPSLLSFYSSEFSQFASRTEAVLGQKANARRRI